MIEGYIGRNKYTGAFDEDLSGTIEESETTAKNVWVVKG
jgi:hypothetical protein